MAPLEPIVRSSDSVQQLQQPQQYEPTQTISLPEQGSPVIALRQSTITVLTDSSPDNSGAGGGGYVTSSMDGGAIAGIVIGSVAGFILLLWIIRSCTYMGTPPDEREPWYRYADPEKRRHRRHHHHRSSYHGSSGSHRHSHRGRSRSSRRASSILSAPPPVVIDYSRGSRKPRVFYGEGDRGKVHYYQTN